MTQPNRPGQPGTPGQPQPRRRPVDQPLSPELLDAHWNFDDPAASYVEEELAELLLATGRPHEAARHAGAAAELLGADAWSAEYEPGRLERLRRLFQPG